MDIPDQDLVARVQQTGDEHAFAALVRKYQSQVRSWARRLCNGDESLADDLSQEAFLKAYMALPAFRGDAKFSVWLYRIVFNVAASKWRKKKLDWCNIDDQVDLASEHCELQKFAADKDIAQAMMLLSEAQRIAIHLCFDEGFSHGEAASVMGVPLGTLKTHVNRAKAKLKTHLASWEPA